jgi:predicted dehydrogenase
MDSIKVGMIGYGYWGPNLARNFYELPSTQLVAIADLNQEQLKRAKAKYPEAILTPNYQEFFKMEMDAVVIATPPKTHHSIAKDCMLHGLNVFVEKPLTQNSREAEELIQIADDCRLTLMVGHIFQFSSAVAEMRKYIESKELGELYYIDTARLNLGLYQRDSNVLWDLAPHDISILLYLLKENPISVSAQGMPCVIPNVYDVAYLNLIFPHNLTAYVHVSWLDPRKVRRVTVVGSKKMAVYNDMETEGKIKIYDKGIDPPNYTNSFGEFEYNYRSGDITIPNIHFVEPLYQECKHFVDCIINHIEPQNSGRDGLRVVKILEAAHRSLAKHATQELIPW